MEASSLMNDWTTQHQHHIAARTAHTAFIGYLVFLFFWTGGIPFSKGVTDLADVTTSSIINQIVIISLFIASSVSLVPLRYDLAALFKREKFLLFFLLWCLITILWSDFQIVSVKRYFQVLAGVVISSAFLLHAKSFQNILKILKVILFIHVFLDITSILLIPGAIDPVFHTWRGITAHKNQLGQISLLSILVWSYTFLKETTGRQKLFSLTMLLLSLLLLLGSRSITPAITLIALTSLGVFWFVKGRFQTIGMGSFFSLASLFTIFGIAMIIMQTDSALINSLPAFFGRDNTFSGRIDIWTTIFSEAKKHLLLGSGYGGFWVLENSKVLTLYNNLHIIIFQSHLGYLDLLNEVGLVGVFLFILMMFRYVSSLNSVQGGNMGLNILFVTGALIINFQETSLFRPNTMLGVLFIFSYLELQIRILRQSQQIISPAQVKVSLIDNKTSEPPPYSPVPVSS